MAIKKMSSHDLMQSLYSSEERISKIESSVYKVASDTQEKMLLLKNEFEYGNGEIEKIENQIRSEKDATTLSGVRNKSVLAYDETKEGVYSTFGSTVHSRFLKEPVNVFNLATKSGPLFRNNMSVSVNGLLRERYKSMLMHTGVSHKQSFFGEYASKDVTIDIEVDMSNLLGRTTCNVIEIAPYLAGSFNIKEVRVYDRHQEGEEPVETMGPLKRVGPSRILLERKREMKKVEIDIEITFQNSSGLYPFGLSHLYFLDADFDPASYVSIKFEKERHIEWIGHDIHVTKSEGTVRTDLTKEGIELYLSRGERGLEYRIEPSYSDHQINELSRNTRTFHARIPLQSKAIVAVEIENIKTR